MSEEEAVFDASIKKKKKPKKIFDIEAALAEGNDVDSPVSHENSNGDKENQEPSKGDDMDFDETLDLDNFGKKKKKKKIKATINLDELEGTLPDGGKDIADVGDKGDDLDDSLYVDMDFSKSMKKKKKKKKDLDELMAEEEDKRQEERDNAITCLPEVEKPKESELEDESHTWIGSDRDYTYDELLSRVFEIMREKNPDMVAGKKQKFVMRPPQVVRIGTKKTSFANFTEICKTLHRLPKHLLDFLLAELGTSGSVDGNSQLIIKGRFQQKQIENVLRRYIKEYVTCHTCRSPDTILQKDTRLFFLQCETCGSRCSVASIKSGFQAVTSKRAAIRAKTA
uniref:Eukaryotic translation initiation factor 2 subunit 2 n=1 Tax=Cacopsylla melanoneura TaxID=428564 RepID=A0A8D8RE90_9HEMI